MIKFKKSLELQDAVNNTIRLIANLSKKWLDVENMVGIEEQKKKEFLAIQTEVKDLSVKCLQNNLIRESFNLLKKYKDCYFFEGDNRHRFWIEDQLISKFEL
jgi:hypothetical protein